MCKVCCTLVEGKRHWEGDKILETTSNALCFSYLQGEISQPALPKCLLFSHCFITAQPDYSRVLLTSGFACLKTSAWPFWSPSASRLHAACSVSGSALEPLVFFTLPYHRHATFQLANHFHQFDSQKNTLFSFLQGMRQDKRSASAGGPKPPSDHICSRAAPQVSLLHSACPALAPLASFPPSLPPSLGSAAGLSPLLPQEVTASTVWHMPQFCFTPLLSSLPLLTSCLSTHSDTHSTLLLWQNWGLQRVSIFF